METQKGKESLDKLEAIKAENIKLNRKIIKRQNNIF
jgi:hypothetical protein